MYTEIHKLDGYAGRKKDIPPQSHWCLPDNVPLEDTFL